MRGAKGEDIADRLVEVAARVVKVVDALPQTPAGRTIGAQLLRCGTSPGANYEEARGAESRADFVHKIAVALKEMQETRYWLRLVSRAELIQSDRMDSLVDEVEQLCLILGKSAVTARSSNRVQPTVRSSNRAQPTVGGRL